MNVSISLVLLVIAACVTVENNTGGTPDGVFGSGARDGTGNPTSCRSACQNIQASCGSITDPRTSASYSVDECTNQCVQIAPPTAMVSCVAIAPSCGAIEDCADGGGGGGTSGGTSGGGAMATCASACHRASFCGQLSDPETGEPITEQECATACTQRMVPQFILECITDAPRCEDILACN
jgi:hypothetical protein